MRAKHVLHENIITSIQWSDVRTNIRCITRRRRRQQGTIWTALNLTREIATPRGSADRRSQCAGCRVHHTTIMEETSMENDSTKCWTTFHGKTQLFDRTGPALRQHGIVGWSCIRVNKRVPPPLLLVHATGSIFSGEKC